MPWIVKPKPDKEFEMKLFWNSPVFLGLCGFRYSYSINSWLSKHALITMPANLINGRYICRNTYIDYTALLA